MPPVSKVQAKAMFAAKAGKSTLGIPPNVGAEFVAAMPKMSSLPEHVAREAHVAKHVQKRLRGK